MPIRNEASNSKVKADIKVYKEASNSSYFETMERVTQFKRATKDKLKIVNTISTTQILVFCAHLRVGFTSIYLESSNKPMVKMIV